jgi:hypothetical protein
MKPMIPALLLIAFAACANGSTREQKLDAQEAKALAKALEGKVAGKPVSCVSIRSGSNLTAVGDNTLVYRINKNLTYRNDLRGSCFGLRHGDALVMQVWGSQYCRGDFAHAVDLMSGMRGGSCSLGEFVPYTTAPAAGG